MQAILNSPVHTIKDDTPLTKEDVWGKFTKDHKRIHMGMIVARGKSSTQLNGGKNTICPVWGDELGYKDVTIVCDKSIQSDVAYWLEYVHGGDCISDYKEIENNKIAMRSEYQCW